MFKCDFCQTETIAIMYEVPESQRGSVVGVCNLCGLVQTFYTTSKKYGKKISVTSGPDWGNIRVGKSIIFDKLLPFLETNLPWETIHNILDIGANRGDFIRYVRKKFPEKTITAVEPDQTLISEYPDDITHVPQRIEETNLKKKSFDLIYSVHTLEHARSARIMIDIMHSLLSETGLLFLDVPSFEYIQNPNITEEFFIDKHSFHFSIEPLRSFLVSKGFAIDYEEIRSDHQSILFVMKKKNPEPWIKNFQDAAKNNKEILETYKKTISINKHRLKKLGQELNRFMDRQRVVYWGAGRIFDSLVRYGNLNTNNIIALIDQYLGKFIETTNGVPIQKPDVLRTINADVVIILAHSSARDIEKLIRSFGVQNVIKFSDLMTNVE